MIFRGFGSILLGNPIFCDFSGGGGGRGGSGPRVPPLDPRMKFWIIFNFNYSNDEKLHSAIFIYNVHAKRLVPDQIPRYAASDLGLYYWPRDGSISNFRDVR